LLLAGLTALSEPAGHDVLEQWPAPYGPVLCRDRGDGVFVLESAYRQSLFEQPKSITLQFGRGKLESDDEAAWLEPRLPN